MHTLRANGRMRLVTDHASKPPESDGIPTSNDRPIIQASSERGVLRRATFSAIDVALEATGPKRRWTLTELRRGRQGGVFGVKRVEEKTDKASKEKKPAAKPVEYIDVNDIAAIRISDPLQSLFGEMGRKVSGKFGVHNVVIDDGVKVETRNFVRTDDFERDPSLLGIITEEAQKELIALGRLSRKKSALTQERREIARELYSADTAETRKGEIKKRLKDIRDESNKIDPNIKQVLSFQYIPAGAEGSNLLTWRMVTLDELAFSIAGIKTFGAWPRIGGHASKNYGFVTFSYPIEMWDGSKYVHLGTIRHADMNDWGSGIVVEGAEDGLLRQAERRWDEIVASRFKGFIYGSAAGSTDNQVFGDDGEEVEEGEAA